MTYLFQHLYGICPSSTGPDSIRVDVTVPDILPFRFARPFAPK